MNERSENKYILIIIIIIIIIIFNIIILYYKKQWIFRGVTTNICNLKKSWGQSKHQHQQQPWQWQPLHKIAPIWSDLESVNLQPLMKNYNSGSCCMTRVEECLNLSLQKNYIRTAHVGLVAHLLFEHKHELLHPLCWGDSTGAKDLHLSSWFFLSSMEFSDVFWRA